MSAREPVVVSTLAFAIHAYGTRILSALRSIEWNVAILVREIQKYGLAILWNLVYRR